jgi:hypothetical protein
MFKQLGKHLVDFSTKEWHKNLYSYGSYLSILLILVTYSGVIYVNPAYIHRLHLLLVYYICAILLIRFNPYMKPTCSAGHMEFDRKIGFIAGLLLFTTTIAKQVTEFILPKFILTDFVLPD